MASLYNLSSISLLPDGYASVILGYDGLVEALVIGAVSLGAYAYSTRAREQSEPLGHDASSSKTRSIVDKMEEKGTRCVVFYGSQTGTAEMLASRLATEGKRRFGLETMVANLEDYDFDTLDALPSDKIAVFLLASFGDGEPTDNAVDFYQFISQDDAVFSQARSPPLDNLQYAAFGLGDHAYEFFNAMVHKADEALTKLGGQRIGDVGEGDDGSGTMEEDFVAWKERFWTLLAGQFGLEDHVPPYEPSFEMVPAPGLTRESSGVYLGEINEAHLAGAPKQPFNAHNPFIAPIIGAQELFSSGQRSCLHLDIDISGSGLSVQAGDHVAIWPSNPDQEVNRLLGLLGLKDRRDEVIYVRPFDRTVQVPVQSPTTYDTILRYYLDICGPVSRQFVASLAAFAPDTHAKDEITLLATSKEHFHSRTHSRFFSIASLLADVSQGKEWSEIPFSLFLESLPKLQPRYYSISSSPLRQPSIVSVTSVVKTEQSIDGERMFYGLASNYLSALKRNIAGTSSPPPGLSYDIMGPRGKYRGIHLPIHIRQTKFRLPSSPAVSIIMIGPGTGVAPFRGFVQERSKQAEAGQEVGRSLLFFGCRKSSEDFLYRSEWEEHKKILGSRFELITAFSRETSEKVYVQHRLQERAQDIIDLVSEGAHVYVCGDASSMARQVAASLESILANSGESTVNKGQGIVKGLKAENRYQEDTW